MGYEVACSCGHILRGPENLAGWSLACRCGRMVRVPAPEEAPSDAITAAPPPPAPAQEPGPEPKVAAGPAPRPGPPEEVIPPTVVSLRTEYGTLSDGPKKVMAALTQDDLWVQDAWRLRRVRLADLANVEAQPGDEELVLTLGQVPSGERLVLRFATGAEGRHWRGELEARRQWRGLDPLPGDPPPPEGVVLLGRKARLPHEFVGRVEYTDQTAWAAERGLQLRAGMWGADAVFEWGRHSSAGGGHYASGIAVRVRGGDAQRVRRWAFGERVGSVARWMALLLAAQAVLLVFITVGFGSLSRRTPVAGLTPAETLLSAALGVGLGHALPLALVGLLLFLRGPQVVRAAGLAVLAVTAGRALVGWVGHVLGAQAAGVPLPGPVGGSVVADACDCALAIAGVALCVRAWRVAATAATVLPAEDLAPSGARRAFVVGLFAVTAVYALGLSGLSGAHRYHQQISDPVTPLPREDPRRLEAGRVLNEGVDRAKRGDLDGAERSYQRALGLWEELAQRKPAHPVDRLNLAITLNNLGWLRNRQDRPDEAEEYLARAVALADGLAGDPVVNDEFRTTMANARDALTQWREARALKALQEKARAGDRKYEEAQVKANKGAVEAEALYAEAIALWEEVLPQVPAEQFKNESRVQIALAYLQLGEFRQQLRKRPEAEAAFKKSIEYGEKAVEREPDRLLARHNLEVARRSLDALHEQALREEISRLWDQQRFADALERCARGVAEQEEQLRTGKDREAASRRLAYRLERYARLLAHCPEWKLRDTKLAVQQARRATDLQKDEAAYWYTLALVQYRNGEWKNSLESLDEVKKRAGEFEASDWLLVAMNRHQLKQPVEARAALKKAVEWIKESQQKAEGNPVLRFQLETNRPALEALRHEAEELLKGSDVDA